MKSIITNSRDITIYSISDISFDGIKIFENQIFDSPLELIKIKAEKLIFNNCIFNYTVVFKRVKAVVEFNKCVFDKNIDFYDHSANISFIFCEIEKRIKINSNKNSIEFLESVVNELVLINANAVDRLKIHSSRINFLTYKSSSTDNLISSGSLINFLDISSDSKCFLLFVNTTIGEIVLAESMKNQIIRGDYKGIFHIDASRSSWLNISDTLLSIQKSYEVNRQFVSADLLLVRLRKARMLSELYDTTKPNYSKLGLLFKYFFLGVLFGWGTRVSNPVITGLLIMLVYAVSYFLNPQLTHYVNSSSFFEAAYQSFLISIARFFHFGEFAYDHQFFRFFDIQESIIGYIILIVISAIFVRKIVR